jgi:LacI family transcriptional regulator
MSRASSTPGGRAARGGGKAPTVYDVAEAAGVSIATVSRVLRRPHDVRPETRERVLETVRALGYVPSASARGLAGRSTGVLGLVLPSFDAPGELGGEVVEAARLEAGDGLAVSVHDDRSTGDDDRSSSASLYFDEVVRGAEAEAWRRGFALMLAAGRDDRREALLDDIAGRVDGLMVVASVVPEGLLERIGSRIPTVVVADADAVGFERVLVANEVGMHALVERMLADHPVDRVAWVSGPEDSSDEHDRRAGFDRALRGCGREVAVVTERGDFTERSGREAAQRLLDAPGGLPDAIVCANDQTALGVLDLLARRGVDVPGRVLVTGFDGVDAGRFSVPRLTSVRQPMIRLGRLAVAALVDRIAEPDAAPRIRTLPVEVLLRESCPPAP